MENTNINEVAVNETVKENKFDQVVSSVNQNLGSLGMFSHGYDLEKIEGTTVIAAKKTFQLKNKLGKKDTLTVRNTDDLASLETISNIQMVTDRADLAICYHLAKLDNKATIDRLGLKSISDIGFGVFDIARTTTTQYARIGKIFVDYSEELGYHFKSNVLPTTLTKGHLIEFLAFITKLQESDEKMTVEEAIQYIEDMYLDEYLNDNMSTKTLRKKLKEYRTTIDGEAVEVETKETKQETEESKQETEESKQETKESKPETEETKQETEETKENSQLTTQQIITDTLYAIDSIQANFMKLSDTLMNKSIQIDIDSIAMVLKNAMNKLLEN